MYVAHVYYAIDEQFLKGNFGKFFVFSSMSFHMIGPW